MTDHDTESDSRLWRNLGDEPISEAQEDQLGFKPWAMQVARMVLDARKPLTVGLFGDWGMGKTSLLNLVEKQVSGSASELPAPIVTVRFNPWRYERESVLLLPLVQNILDALEEQVRKNCLNIDLKPLENALRALVRAVSFSGKLGRVGLSFSGKTAIQEYEKLEQKWVDEQIRASTYYQIFKALEEGLYAAIDSGISRIIVFVDDLDRCMPDRALALLQQMKLVLGRRGLVFVIALDPGPIEEYLEKQLAELHAGDAGERARFYLEKLIQVPLWIPSHEQRFQKLVEKAFQQDLSEEEYRKLPIDYLHQFGKACDYNPRSLARLQAYFLYFLRHFFSPDFNADAVLLTPLSASLKLRSDDKKVYDALFAHPRLCEQLADCRNRDELLIVLREHNQGLSANDEMGENRFHMPIPKTAVLNLLVSGPGRDWLRNPRLRKSAEDLLAFHDNFDQHQRKQVDRALGLLDSDNPNEIIAACETLIVLDHPECKNACDRLRDLSGHTEARVRENVEIAIVRIGCRQDVRPAPV